MRIGYPSGNDAAKAKAKAKPLAKKGAQVEGLSLEDALQLQRDLIEAFGDKDFQLQLKLIEQRLKDNPKLGYERQAHFLTVQNKVMPKYGFPEGQKGVMAMLAAMRTPANSGSAEFQKNNDKINSMLGITEEENDKEKEKMALVTVKHAINSSDSVKLSVLATSTLAQVKEQLSVLLARPDIAKKGRMVNKDPDTNYFSGAKETSKIGNQRTFLLLGVDDLKATRKVPNVTLTQAMDLMSEVMSLLGTEPTQRGLMEAQWFTSDEKKQNVIKADVMERTIWNQTLPKYGLHGSGEGWSDFQNVTTQYFQNDEFATRFRAIVDLLEESFLTMASDVAQYLPFKTTSIIPRPNGGVYMRWDMPSPVPPLATGEVHVVRSAKGTADRWSTQPALVLSEKRPDGKASVIVDASVRYQTLLGFGGSFTESSALLFSQMSRANQARLVDSCFAVSAGLGYFLGRMHMNSCDFSAGGWSCCDKQGDTGLLHFSVDRYKKTIFPLMHQCQDAAGGTILTIASPWSPPSWMKDTEKMLSGGKLKPNLRETWARFYVRFIKELEVEGLPLFAMTVQNEPMAHTPWENCLYTAEEERDFVRDHLGPALKKSGSDVKLLVWDHNREEMLARARAIYADKEAAQYVWGVAFHWYGDPRYESWPDKAGMLCYDNVRLVHELRPEKHLVMTEACQEGGPHTGEWQTAERYAENIIKDLNNYTEAWVDWNLWLDKRGGPNHVGNFCSAPILVDPERDLVLFQPSYYYIGQFSRYIQPGAERIMCGSSRDALETTAFANPDGTKVVVVLNQGTHGVDFWLETGDRKSVV